MGKSETKERRQRDQREETECPLVAFRRDGELLNVFDCFVFIGLSFKSLCVYSLTPVRICEISDKGKYIRLVNATSEVRVYSSSHIILCHLY